MQLKKASKYLSKEFIEDWLFEKMREYMWPNILSAITFLSGLFGDVPFMYVIVATTFVFSTVSFGMFWYSRWNYYRTPEWKLSFSKGIVFWDDNKDGTASVTLGFEVVSSAEFPIKFYVDEIKTSIGSSINQDPSYKTRKLIVPPNGSAFFYDDMIRVDIDTLKQGVEGRMRYKIKYGSDGNEMKYQSVKGTRCHLSLDENSMLHNFFTDTEEYE